MARYPAFLFSGAILAALLVHAPVQAAFVLTNDNGGDGHVAGLFPTFSLFSADNGAGTNITTYTDTITTAQMLSFDWNYITHDSDGSFYDPAGYLVNDIYTQLSTDSTVPGTINSSGTVTLTLAPGSIFGWYATALDGIGGRGELGIQATLTSVPEPATLVLLGTFLIGMGLIRWHR